MRLWAAQFLTAETAKLHTLHEIVKHFNATEQARAFLRGSNWPLVPSCCSRTRLVFQGVKNYMTRKARVQRLAQHAPRR